MSKPYDPDAPPPLGDMDEAEIADFVEAVNPAPNFEGYQPRECGEHRTVGPHRAWCFDCHEWCYANHGSYDPTEIACHGCWIAFKNAKPKEYVYRVTRKRKHPHYWASENSTKIVSRRAMRAILKSEAGYGEITTVKIERAELGPWQEIGPGDWSAV